MTLNRKRILVIACLVLASACENEPLPPDAGSSPDARPIPEPGPLTQGRELGLIEPQGRTGPHGFQVPEDGDNPPAPPLGDPARVRAELAALERELLDILAPLIARLDARGVTREQLEDAMGDIRAERILLGLSLPEYHEIQRRIDSVLERARPLLDVPRPLTRDGRGGGEEICTTDRDVDELDDGTIIITDTESCRPGFPEDGGSSGGCLLGGPGCGDGPGGGGGPGSMFTQFEQDCHDAGGVVEGGSCQCAQSKGCIATVVGSTLGLTACVSVLGCAASIGGWALAIWLCDQRPCEAVNRHHGAPQ